VEFFSGVLMHAYNQSVDRLDEWPPVRPALTATPAGSGAMPPRGALSQYLSAMQSHGAGLLQPLCL